MKKSRITLLSILLIAMIGGGFLFFNRKDEAKNTEQSVEKSNVDFNDG